MKRHLVKAVGLLFIIMLSVTSCRTVSEPVTLSPEAKRNFDYFFLEAVKHKLAGNHDVAYSLFDHCWQINPYASEVAYELGLYYMALGDKEKGCDFLVRACDLEDNNIYYKEALASYYLRERDFKQALPVLEDMVRCNPSRSDVLAQLVSLYKDNNQLPEAISAINRIELLEGKNVALAMEKFRLYREMNDEKKAFSEIESLIKENPNDASYKVLLGDQYMLVDQYDKALEIYNEVKSTDPENQALRLSMLDYYKQTSQDSLYKSQFDSLLYDTFTDEKVRVTLMRNYILDNENSKADSTLVLETFDKIFSSVPPSVDMLALYGSYVQLKNMGDDKLSDAMDRILEIEPDNQVALYQSILISSRISDYRKVVEICNKGISYYPDVLPYYFYQGFAYYQLDDAEKALEVLKRGTRYIKPETDKNIISDLYSVMGDLYYEIEQKDSAFAAYDSCLVYKSDNLPCLNNYAYYLSLENEQLDKAEEMSYRTIKIEPGNKVYLDTYAWILFIKGKYTEAKIYIDKVVEGDLNSSDVSSAVLEHAGDIYSKCGDADKALYYWELALKKGGQVSEQLKNKIKQKKYIEP